MIVAADVLNIELPNHPVVDFFRVLVAFLGLVHLLFAVARFLWQQTFWIGIAFMATGLLTSLQLVESIGDPFIPWRLPLYALMNVAGIVYLYKMGRYGHEYRSYDTGDR